MASQKNKLGKTDLELCPIGIGGWQLSGPLMLDGKADGHADMGRDEVLAMATALAKKGLHWIDTAAQYGNGEGEMRVGEILANTAHDWTVISKFGATVGANSERVHDLSYDQSCRTLESSLKNLGVDTIDIYLCHVDPATMQEAEQVARFFDTATSEKMVRYVGISTNTMQACEWLHALGYLDVVEYDHNMSLSQPDFLHFLQMHHIGGLVRGVLARGQLSGKYSTTSQPAFDKDDIRSTWDHDFALHRHFAHLTTPQRSIPQLAVRYILDQPTTHGLVWGGKSVEQYDDALHALQLPALTDAEHADILRIQQRLAA